MQENNTEQPPSLSQLLRESYLAQQRHSEMSRSDASSTRLQIYGSLKGKADGSVGHSDPQLPDLSAFLSQEELDKSVNLARQAIGHEAQEERGEVRASVTPLTPSNISAVSVSSPAAPSLPLAKPPPAPLVAPSAVSFIQPAAEFKEPHVTLTSDRKMHKASSRQDNMLRNSRDTGDGFNDLSRPARNAPYGLETQSKKEFLNKAADFIEELSSLFKANSAKRVRPRACKAHRSRAQKNQDDGTVGPLTSDNRERTVVALEAERERLGPAAVSHQPEAQLDPGIGHVAFEDCRTSEEQRYDPVAQEAEVEAQGCALIETPYAAEAAVCEPPHFIQKLKSREVPEGSKVQLDCIVRGNPVPEVRWFCEGKELENSPDIQILSNGERHSLIITEAFEEDTGRYSCFASNFYGTDSISAEIYVEGASSSDSEGEQHFEHTAQLQTKTQSLASSQSPNTEDPLPSQPESAAEEPAEEPPSPPSNRPLLPHTSTSALSVPELSKAPGLSPAHAAQEARTPSPAQAFPASPPSGADLGEVTQAVPAPPQLLQTAVVPSARPVQAAPTQAAHPEVQTSTHDGPQGSNQQPGTAAPVFTKSLQDLVASEGQLVVLECRVKGEPSPRVDWHREGRIIQDSPEFRILQKKPRSPAESEEICTLVIAEVFAEDSGMFTCTASNSHGAVSSSAELKVKGDGRTGSHARPVTSLTVLSNQVQELSPSVPAVTHQPEATVMNNKPHSSTLRLDPLASSTIHLDPLAPSTIRLDPLASSTIRLDPLASSTIRLDPLASSTIRLDPLASSTIRLDPLASSTIRLDPLASSTIRLDPLASSTIRLDPLASSTIRLDPLASSTIRLDPFSTSVLRVDPSSSSMLRPDPVSVTSPNPEPTRLSWSSSGLNSHSGSIPSLDPPHLNRDTRGPSGACVEPPSSRQALAFSKALMAPCAVETIQDGPGPRATPPDTSPKVKEASEHQNGSFAVVPLPDPPPNSCLKTGAQANHRGSRSRARGGRRVHFKLPEEEEVEQSDGSSPSDEDAALASASRGPPPVLAKPKLDPAQLQLLHNQVLMEQQQETEPQTPAHVPPQTPAHVPPQTPAHVPLQTPAHVPPQTPAHVPPQTPARVPPQTPAHVPLQTPARVPPQTPAHVPLQTPAHVPPQTPAPFQIQPVVPSVHEGPLWSPRMPRDPYPPPFQLFQNTTPVQPTLHSAPPLTSALSAPAINTTSPAPSFSSPPSIPQLKTSSLTTSPLPAPHLNTAPPLSVAPATQMNTIHASHLNLSPAALFKTAPAPPFCSPPAPKLSTVSTNSTPALQQITSPASLLRSTHASLMNLTATSHSFSYTRPKEFIAAQAFSPVMSPSPVESPVPLLQELAAELNSSAASSPTLPPFPPPPRIFPTRVLTSPTSPPSLVTSPTPGSGPFPSSVFALRTQSPPQASSPTSSSSTPSPILNPVAFLSSVLPSLAPSQPTNSMGLPKRAPLGPQRKTPKMRLPSAENIRDSKELVLHEIEKKLRFKDDTPHFAYQQKLRNEGKTVSRPLGPNIPATVINYHEEYKVSSFEQRLMSEIEFRLERTPVEESDDEVQHDDVPTGKCIAPVFDRKLRSFRATEGGPVTFSCKIVGIPVPKVYWFKDGKQILKKDFRYRKIREGDGTCALHIESTTGDDDGNYTVMAANPQGRLSCSGHLIVQTGPPRNRMTPVQPQRVRSRIQEVEGEQTHDHVFRPHFVQAPGDLLAHEGRLCRLDCKVSGLPSPELMWLVNGRPIYPDLTHKMLVRENSIHSLVIDPLTQNDGGTYTCIASNKAGQSSFSLELRVVEREMKHPPQFVEKLQNMGIPEGSPVRLECRVLAVPPPLIFWKKDNDTLDKSKDRFSMTQDPTGYVCLLIQPTTKDDAGWYTVSARNEAGVVACTCRLDIYAQWHQSIPEQMKRAPRAGSRYAALTGQGLDIKAAFPTPDTSPILFSSSPPEAMLESEEL